MIGVDTSALVAILLDEPESASFAARITGTTALIAAPTALELEMVVSSRKNVPTNAAAALMSQLALKVAPWTERHLAIARDAFARFGKGRGHPAQLNFGDCISYALARAENVPLLFKGGDFALTDVRAAL